MTIEYKVCTKCSFSKPLVEFRMCKCRNNYVYPQCKKCVAEYQKSDHKIRYNKNKTIILERIKVWKRKNKDKWLPQNIKRNKEWIAAHKEEHRMNRRKLYSLNKEKHKELVKKNRYKRLKVDSHFRLICALRSSLNIAFKKQKAIKNLKTLELLGCDLQFAKKYIEEKFTKGMSWKNYGMFGWHIDHIKPICLFDLSKLDEQKKCFHYTNLQPLWAKDNLRKSYKYTPSNF